MESSVQNWQTIEVDVKRGIATIQINRAEQNNSLNTILIREMITCFDHYEADHSIKLIIIKGNPTHFCTGLDFQAIANQTDDALSSTDDPDLYYELLKKISLCSKIVIAAVEGKVNAGGIGIVAACDLVFAGENASFGLSEALFGLLPACVMPFLIQRIGFQKAKWLTLITQAISVEKATQIGLVDESTTDLDNLLRITSLRLLKLENDTVGELKNYMSKLWIINDETQRLAVEKINQLLYSDKVQTNIYNFVHYNKFPWEK